MLKSTLIVTVLNEEDNIESLINSIKKQSILPEELVIVDGGSMDNTVKKLEFFKKELKSLGIKFKLLTKLGNRSIGRNEAVRQASNEIILCTDSGCVLKENWCEEMIKEFVSSKANNVVHVVAGYYQGLARNIFQKSLIPFVLVMADKVDSDNFLPASRSMAFTKEIWAKVGGFSEELFHNEDYEFAQRLRKIGAKIVFNMDAVVYWIPRETVSKAFYMFYRFALGDMEAGIIRPKVILIFLRYLIGIAIFLSYFFFDNSIFLYLLGISFMAYLVWAIAKNYRYVKEIQAFYYLPLLQLISDLAVISGSLNGLISLKKK